MNKLIKKLRLFAVFWVRIVFARNNLKCPFLKKIRANFGGGYLADQWILYDFDHNNKNEYLSEFDWHKSRFINGKFDYVLNNKVIAAEVMKQYVKVPESHVIKVKGLLTDFCSKEIEYSDVINLLKEKKQLFIKPIGVGKGKGVNILVFDGEKLFVDDKERNENEIISLLKDRDDWFISEAIIQHQYANDLYEKTVNTMRIITFRDIETKKFKVFYAVQRIGTAQTIPVDNGSRGGLVAKIDLETGKLSEARSLHNTEVYKCHPDSNKMIEGAVVPCWSDIKMQIVELAEKMPYLHFIAWDVVITENGEMCIIEGNSSSGVNIIQLWGGQRYGELGKFYRHHGVKC